MRWILILLMLVTAGAAYGFDERFDGPVINYRKAKADANPVGKLKNELSSGESPLPRGEDSTGLVALLKALTRCGFDVRQRKTVQPEGAPRRNPLQKN